MSDDRFSREIDRSARKLEQARREPHFFGRSAALLGVGGWLFVVPVVAGAYLGRYLDRRFADGQSWTLTLIILGIGVGAFNFWQYYRRGSRS